MYAAGVMRQAAALHSESQSEFSETSSPAGKESRVAALQLQR